MRKKDELTNPNSCMSRAGDDEMTFVLLGRDRAAPKAIRVWIKERIKLGLNKSGDTQLAEAALCARQIELDRARKEANRIVRGLMTESKKPKKR